MFYQIKSYIKFWFRSSNAHGIHSPFVYDLITKCFYDKTQYPEYSILKSYRQQLIKSSESIEITDFGAGSRVFKSNSRAVAAIAKNAGISEKRQKLLFRMVRYFNSEKMLELGTSLGLATAAMSLGNIAGGLTTVEGCTNTSEIAKRQFEAFKLKNIQLQNLTFESFFTKNSSEAYDLIYIDGNHDKTKTLQYFEILLKQKTNNCIFIFDDIYWSAEMTEALQQIFQHPQVTVSIDTFSWGLVFFRSEQPKQHFTIRL